MRSPIFCFLFLMVMGLVVGFPELAFAHRVTVFAWVEGDTVYTESKFSGGKRVVDGTIKVYDGADTVLVEGRTDDQGEFSFKIPGKPPLTIELNAGMGHMAKWTLTSEDLGDMPVLNEPPAPGPIAETTQDRGPAPVSRVSPAELEALMEKVMDRKLKPITKMLAESSQKDPSLPEILGGIGYIIGLLGIAAYVRYRKTGKDK